MVWKIKPQRAQRVVIFTFRPLCVLCVLCGFPKPYFENIKSLQCFNSLSREILKTQLTSDGHRR